MKKLSEEEIAIIIKENWHIKTNYEIGVLIGKTESTVRLRARKLHLPDKKKAPVEKLNKQNKTGLELRADHVLNWTNKTIITDLGEFGSFVCSFDMHNAIQRSYVDSYEGKGDKAAQVATRFDFPHAKAVYKYAKIHGFSKASIPQTDLEFEMGLTPEEAVEENIQSLKRKTYKETERRKWLQTQQDADKWNNFHHTVLKSLENHLSEFLPTYKQLSIKIPKVSSNFAAVVGIADLHYMKFCFDRLGNTTYDRPTAIKMLKVAVEELVAKMLKQGKPAMIYLPVGSDNLHVDNMLHTTTKGTLQVGATDGNWVLELKNYVVMNLNLIDLLSQVAPVTLVPTRGNHDAQSSHALNAYLSIHYQDSKRVTFKECYHPRVYTQFGDVCMIFNHGDDMSEKKMQSGIADMIINEASEHGIIGAKHYILFTQHIHTDSFRQLSSRIAHIIMPSLSGTDQWHREQGYIGRQQAAIYLIDAKKGKDSIFYSSQ